MGTDKDGCSGPGVGADERPPAGVLLDVAAEALAGLAADPLTPIVDDETLTATIARLAQIASMAQAEKLRRVAVLNARRVDDHPSHQASRLMGAQPGLSRSEARAETETAAALGRLPRTAAAFAAGHLTPSKAREAARGLAEVDRLAAQGAAVPDDAADRLDALVAGQRPDADRGHVRRAVDDFAERLGADVLADREARAHANRRVWLGPAGPDGTAALEGRLDAVGRATLAAALDALSRPTGPDDERTAAQRRHDALVTLAERSLDAGDLPLVAAQRPHVVVTGTREAFDGLGDADPALLDGYGPISSATARMIACDGEVTEIVVDRHGRPLQVKETGRPTAKQRLAVLARDRQCIGCGAPASRCQLHHVRWRRNKGATVVENLTMVCRACHHAIHHQGWTVTRTTSGPYRVSRPAAPTAAPGDLRHTA